MNFFSGTFVQSKFVHLQLLLISAFQHFLVRSAVGLVIDYHQSAVLFKSAVDVALNNDNFISRIFGNVGIYIAGTNSDGNFFFTQEKR